MVSIVTGSGAGLVNSSRDVLGSAGEIGHAAAGRAGERVTVNAANGNLVVQDRDEYLVGIGPDVDVLRTYNSQASWDGDNSDGWRIGFYRRVWGGAGAPNTAGSTIKRTDPDGHESTYYFNASQNKYFTAEGSGQYDILSYSGGTWTWTDGDTGTTESYEPFGSGSFRLKQVTDLEGHHVKVGYDGAGLISTLSTFKAGSSTADEVVTLSYTGTLLSRITTSYKDTLGAQKTRSVTSYSYESNRLSKVTTDLTPDNSAVDADIYTVSYGYDAVGRLQTITQKDGSQQTIEWTDGRVRSITEQTVLEFWPDGRAKTVRDDRKTSFLYNTVDRITTITVRRELSGSGVSNVFTQAQYDALGRLDATIDERQRTTDYIYLRNTGDGRQVTVRDPAGDITTRYDALDRVVRRVDRNNHTVIYSYDAVTRKMTMKTEEGVEVTTETTVHGQVYQVADAFGTTTYAYDAHGNLLTTKDAAGNVTKNSYDQNDNLTRVVQGLKANGSGDPIDDGSTVTTSYSFDAANRILTQTVDPDGALKLKTIYEYDGQGRKTRITDPRGTVTTQKFTAKGELQEVIVDDVNGGLKLKTSYAYDAESRVLTVIEGDGTTAARKTEYKYDVLGRRTQEIVDPNGIALKTSYEYDAAGHVLVKRNNLNEVVGRYLYDAAGRLLDSIDGTGAVTRNVYDKGELKATLAMPTRLGAGWQSDTDSALATRINALIDGAESVNLYVYDKDGRLTHTVNAAGEVSRRIYDKANRAVETVRYATRLSGPTAATVDALATQARNIAGKAEDQHSYARYDAIGRLTCSVDATGAVSKFAYDRNGHVVTQSRYAKLITLPLANGVDPSVVPDASNDRIDHFTYDSAGRERFHVDAEGHVTETRYDDANARTTSLRYEKRLGGGDSYTPAATAPALSAFTAALPGLGAATSTVRELDRAGRLILQTDGNNVQTQFTYDAAGRLQTEVQASNITGQSSTTRHVYNAAGQRTAVIRADGTPLASTTRFEYDNLGRLWRQIDARGVTLAEGGGGDWGQRERFRLGFNSDSDSGKAALLKAHTTEYGYDLNNRVTKTIDAMGGVTQTEYDAFGNASVITDARGYKRYQVYDKAGRLAQSIDAERYLTVYGYDAFGNLSSSTRVNAKVQGTLASGQAVTLATTAPGSGTYVLVNAANDHATGRLYDRDNRLLKETDAENHVEGTDALDAFGQRLTAKNRLGASFVYCYDRLGRLLTETLPVQARDGAGTLRNVVNEYQYDSRGNRIVSIEAKGLREQRTMQMRYDGANRLTMRIGMGFTAVAANDTTSVVIPADTWRYDARGNLIEQISHGQLQADGVTVNGARRTVSYYDFLDRKIMEVNPDRVITRSYYDPVGNLVVQTMLATRLAAGTPINPAVVPTYPTEDYVNDRTRRYAYDGLGRLVQVSLDFLYAWDGGDGSNIVISDLHWQHATLEQFFYDAAGNLTESKNGRGYSSYSYYDANGRKVMAIDQAGAVTRWEYGRAVGAATKETRYSGMLPGGYGRQSSVAANAAPHNDPVQLAVLAENQPSRVADDDRVTEYSLDRLGRVTEKRVLKVAQDLVDASGNRSKSLATAKTAYSHDGLGNVTQMRELAAVQGGVETWEDTEIVYDGLGRETKRQGARFTDWQGSLVRPTTEIKYDGLGNVEQRIQRGKDQATESDDRFTRYGYDANGLLSKVTDAVGAVTEYAYNNAGDLARRTAKDVRRSDSTVAAPKLRDIVVRYERDAVGRIVAETSLESDKAAAAETRKTRYNAFGEVSGRGIGDGWEEFFEYSTLGKLVKTNTGTGAIKYYLHDAAGNQTREISIIGNNYDPQMSLRDAACNTSYYSRVSLYNRRNQLIKTIDPTFHSLRPESTIQELYTQSWVTSWSPPSTDLISGGLLQTGSVSVSGSRITLSLPGARYARFAAPDYYIYGQSASSEDGTFTFNLATPELMGKGPCAFSIRFYRSIDDTAYSSYGWTLGANGGTLTVDASGNGTLNVATAPPYPATAPAGIMMPAQSGYESTYYSFQVTDISNGRSFSDGAVAYGPTAPGGSRPARIHFPASFQHSDSTPHILEVRYVCHPSGNVATMRLSYSSSGTLQHISTQAQGVPSQIKLYIRGRNVPNAEVDVGGRKVVVAGTYTAPVGEVPGYTLFTVDPASVNFSEGERFYTLKALDANFVAMLDEVGTAIRQDGKIVFTNYNLPPQVLRQQTSIKGGATTVTRLQDFNAFGEVSEERDERVEQRMLAALNSDPARNGLSPLTALTADQKAAARTTLKYNNLGQLIAKIDPETFITAENGYRYRARPETRYGYDLLGRHTTMQDANGNLSRVSYLAGSRGEGAQTLKEFDAAGENADVFNANGGGVRENKFDVFGNAVVAVDALGAVTERAFDARDRLVQVTRKGVQRLVPPLRTTTTTGS